MSLLALLAACAQQPTAREDFVARLAPLTPIAGLAGFQSTSTLLFEVDPERPHVFETTYVFPGRVRWHLALHDPLQSARHLEYRCADAFFELANNERTSTCIADEGARRDKCAASELRRALFLWPDGFDWQGADDLRTAKTECGATLTARLGERGRPIALSVGLDDRRGQLDQPAAQSYVEITWREARGRWWPATMKLELGLERIWTETVDSVESAVYLLDEFFVPPDRRVGANDPLHAVVRADLPAAVTLRVALPPGSDWVAARKRAGELAGDQLAQLVAAGWRSDVGQWFELGDDGRPSACLLRLQPSARIVPKGWELARESTALYASVAKLDTAFAPTLAALRAAIPAGASGARPLVRIVASALESRVQLMLPLRPAQ